MVESVQILEAYVRLICSQAMAEKDPSTGERKFEKGDEAWYAYEAMGEERIREVRLRYAIREAGNAARKTQLEEVERMLAQVNRRTGHAARVSDLDRSLREKAQRVSEEWPGGQRSQKNQNER
jgi:hypothetical protein